MCRKTFLLTEKNIKVNGIYLSFHLRGQEEKVPPNKFEGTVGDKNKVVLKFHSMGLAYLKTQVHSCLKTCYKIYNFLSSNWS